MTDEERGATELYLKDLEAEFREAAGGMWTAKSAGDYKEYQRRVTLVRRIYRDRAEVEVALLTGVLPF